MAVKVNPIVEKTLMRPLRWISETKLVDKAGTEVYNNNRKYIDGLGVASIILKDGLGCYLYVTQSLNNKDIPDSKRKFVAALDMTNGLLMILLQIAAFFTVSHKVCQSKLFDSAFGKLFDRPIKKTYQQIIKRRPEFKNIDSIEFTKKFEGIRTDVKDAFGGLTSLIAASIIGKRVLVPLIATPLADSVKKKLDKMDEAKGSPVEDKSKPSMLGKSEISKPEAKENIKEKSEHEIQKKDLPEQGESTNLLAKYRK